jgi:hypothetical protein
MYDTSSTWFFMIIALVIILICQAIGWLFDVITKGDNIIDKTAQYIIAIPLLLMTGLMFISGLYIVTGILFYFIAFIKFLWYAA